MLSAPFFAEVADGPDNGQAVWLTASQGVRIRVAIWDKPGAKGTVLLLPGRTEYVEKYGRAAGDLGLRGYATLSVDWRGQGLADRATGDRMVGHVDDFAEFQADLDTMIDCARDQGLPQPFYLISHSMGGCIGLRALLRGIPVKAAAFSAPMWGIPMSAAMRPVAHILSATSRWFNFDHRYTPGTNGKTYVLDVPFVGNTLTTDAEMWDFMRQQALAHPDLSLGGPSLGWLNAALHECHALSQVPSPTVPLYCALGLGEKIVDPGPVHLRMALWQGAAFELYPGSEHEIMMERPATRARFFDAACALFDKHP